MTQFKAGDRVRFVRNGDEGIVQDLASHFGQDSVLVGWADGPEWVDVELVELVEDQPNRPYYKQDAVDPDHYKFPGGAEVIHISQWLTANAGQALQYIARSSRIDGKNKGNAVEDIQKAIKFLTFELERLK